MKTISHLFKRAEVDHKGSTAPMKIEREFDTVELDIAELNKVVGGSIKPGQGDF